MIKVLYPGSFDPLTKGHMDIISEASQLFDEVIIAIMQNSEKKNQFFTPDERLAMIKEVYKKLDNIKVIRASGATVDVALINECKAIVRGIRNASDFDYENKIQQVNRDLSNNQVRTILLFGDKDYQHVSSSMVKEILGLGKDISRYVDPVVAEMMYEKQRSLRR